MKKIYTVAFVSAALLAAAISSPSAHAQGCVAAHTTQPLVSGLSSNDQAPLSGRLHGLTVTVGFRTYSSYKHYVGDVYQVQRAIAHNEVQNHVDLYDLAISYQLTSRWSIISDMPGLTATRHQQGNINVYRDGGIGDITVGAQAWLFRPPTENGGNVAFSTSVKFPSGINNASGTKISSNGKKTILPFDQSIQPGDGSWGFVAATEAYHPIAFGTEGYFTGSYLFNPRSTTGVVTGRSLPGEQVMSATDQYLWRGGLSHAAPRAVHFARGLVGSIGGRMEGVPARDLIGDSKGFRRPGYVISIEPALLYLRGRTTLNLSAPWAMDRDRTTSVNDVAAHTHGDAAFADYTIIASLTRTF
ncbi:MAG TPA: hypothetical protein VGD64_08140 [Acidisarcina sp.]